MVEEGLMARSLLPAFLLDFLRVSVVNGFSYSLICEKREITPGPGYPLSFIVPLGPILCVLSAL